MNVTLRKNFGRLFPRPLRKAIKRRLLTAASTRFHGNPRAQIRCVEKTDTGTLWVDEVSAILPQPFAREASEWLGSHPEDVLELEVLLKLGQQLDGSMFDIGAHIGAFAALYGKVSEHDIYCFEPVPENRKLIDQTAELNGIRHRIQIVAAAVGREVGVATMHVSEATGFAQALNPRAVARESSVEIQTAVTTVDAFRASAKASVALLKIDVEGFEDEVLQGASETLRQVRPVVALEVHNDCLARRGINLLQLLRALTGRGYALLRLNGGVVSAAAAARTILPRSHLLAVPTEERLRFERILAA